MSKIVPNIKVKRFHSGTAPTSLCSIIKMLCWYIVYMIILSAVPKVLLAHHNTGNIPSIKEQDDGPPLPPIASELINPFEYNYYYSASGKGCIVTENKVGNESTVLNTPRIEENCDTYTLGSDKISLPTNVYPICGYEPNWYTTSASSYYQFGDKMYRHMSAESAKYYKKCLKWISYTSASPIDYFYGVKLTDYSCKRMMHYKYGGQGLSPNIAVLETELASMLTGKFESVTRPDMLVDLVMSSTCVGVNTAGCYSAWRHLINENDSSVLNLLGMNNNGEPTTWLYADGVDVETLHITVMHLGLGITADYSSGIPRYHIEAQNLDEEIKPLKPGIVGGKKPNSFYQG